MILRPTQQPTCTRLRVRTTRDANVVFHAVAMNLLPMVARRLDATDRAALSPGSVYVWEERGPDADATGVGMERFTEGRHWNPSRIRDDFLLYTERIGSSDTPALDDRTGQMRALVNYRDRPLLIKQTYSVWVNGTRGLRKWHMNAYYSENSIDGLLTVDDIPTLASLFVPHECYQKARSSRNRDGDRSRNGRRPSTDDETPPAQPPAAFCAYTPYPMSPTRQLEQITITVDRKTSRDLSPVETGHLPSRMGASTFQLVPLDRLQNTGAQTRRERVDEELLRSFRLQ